MLDEVNVGVVVASANTSQENPQPPFRSLNRIQHLS